MNCYSGLVLHVVDSSALICIAAYWSLFQAGLAYIVQRLRHASATEGSVHFEAHPVVDLAIRKSDVVFVDRVPDRKAGVRD